VVNAFVGMGWVFTSRTALARRLKGPVRWALGRAARTGVALVQNIDDERLLLQLGVPREGIRRIAGAGVDLRAFQPLPMGEGVVRVVLPARLLWDKGVGEFVAAARMLRARGANAHFLLAGEPDHANPASISSDQIAAWVREGSVEHLGWVDDMGALLATCDIVCLPSYREGLPKSLIEAAAAGKPIVTTDVPGCREVVRAGENGLLVPPHDAVSLAAALERLIGEPELRRSMGVRGRAFAEAHFGMETVVQQTLALYREVMA
jgi:glycosyltransferase involved in cell wall biosynthesis